MSNTNRTERTSCEQYKPYCQRDWWLCSLVRRIFKDRAHINCKEKKWVRYFLLSVFNYDVHVSIVKCVLFMVQRVYTTSWYFLPRRRFKQICYTIQIACSWTVTAMPVFAFYQTCIFQILECKINCLSVYAALRSNKLSWRIASHVIIALSKNIFLKHIHPHKFRASE